MDERTYQYQIGSSKTPVVLSCLLAAAFGGAAFWLYRTGSDAFIVLLLFFAFALFVFLLTLHRFFFYRVRIGIDGFSYQTRIGNEAFYRYADVKQAWESGGMTQSGMEQYSCNISFTDGRTIRFLFAPADAEAVAYLLRQAAAWKPESAAEPAEYRIDGRYFGKARIAAGVLILVVFLGMDFVTSLVVAGNWMLLLPGGLLALFVCLYLILNYRCFLVKIEKEGFFCRTTPWNGRYYAYREIVSCREIRRVVRRRGYSIGRATGSAETNYYYFFEFTGLDGKKRRFLYESPIHEHEIAVLKERIEQAQNPKETKA